MYLDYENLDPLMEDFNEILLDYDIACEGFIGTARNILSKAIDSLIALFRQAFQYIRTRLKNRNKKIDKDLVSMSSDRIKENVSAKFSNWKMNELSGAFEDAFKINYDHVLRVIPDYKRALETNDPKLAKETKERMKEAYLDLSDELDDTTYDTFLNKPVEITLSSDTPEGIKQVKEFSKIAHVLEKVERIVEGKEAKIMRELQSFRKGITAINDNIEFSDDKDMGAIKDLMQAINRILNQLTKEIKEHLSFVTKISDMLSKDYNVFVNTFLN